MENKTVQSEDTKDRIIEDLKEDLLTARWEYERAQEHLNANSRYIIKIEIENESLKEDIKFLKDELNTIAK